MARPISFLYLIHDNRIIPLLEHAQTIVLDKRILKKFSIAQSWYATIF